MTQNADGKQRPPSLECELTFILRYIHTFIPYRAAARVPAVHKAKGGEGGAHPRQLPAGTGFSQKRTSRSGPKRFLAGAEIPPRTEAGFSHKCVRGDATLTTCDGAAGPVKT